MQLCINIEWPVTIWTLPSIRQEELARLMIVDDELVLMPPASLLSDLRLKIQYSASSNHVQYDLASLCRVRYQVA